MYVKVKQYKPSAHNKETLADIQKLPFRDIPDRNIRQETCEMLGIRVALSEKDGSTIEAVYFPYYDQKGKLSGYKKRDMTVPKDGDFHFTAIGSVGVGCKMFGQQVAEANKRKHSALYVVEGEWDVAASLQAMIDRVQGTKYAELRPFVVGLSCGTANAVESVLHNEHFVKSFDELILGLDNDEATPAEKKKKIIRGKEATENVAAALMADNIFVVQYGDGMKDPSDYLQEGKSHDLANLLAFGKSKFVAEKILMASDIPFDEIIAPRVKGVMIPEFPKLMEAIGGFRKRELVVLTSGVNVGKSTVTSIFGSGFLKAGERVGFIYLEETRKETMQRMIASYLKVNYNKFKNSPLSCATEAQIREAYDAIADEDRAVFVDHFGYLPIQLLMNKLKYLHHVCGCGYIILDHLALCTSGGGADEDERKVIDHVMTELAAFCAANDVCVIAVSHINRSGFADNKPPKDADENPYWVKVDKSHMRGSSSLEALAWIVLGLEGQVMPDRSRGNSRVTVLKNRPWGTLGVCDEFRLNGETWEVELVVEEEYSTGF